MVNMVGGAQFSPWRINPTTVARSASVPPPATRPRAEASVYGNFGTFNRFEYTSEPAPLPKTKHKTFLEREKEKLKCKSRGRMNFTGHRGYSKYETPFWPEKSDQNMNTSNYVNPHEFPRLNNGIGWVPIPQNPFDRAKKHFAWQADAREQELPILKRPDWVKIGKTGPRPQYGPRVLRSALPSIILDLETCLKMDWPQDSPTVHHLNQYGKTTMLVKFKIGRTGELGKNTYMNRFMKHHEIVHKWALEKVLKNWGVVAGEGEHTEVQYEIRCPWAVHTAVEQYYDLHPDLVKVFDAAQMLALAKYEGEVTPTVVFKQLQKYIAKYHSNIVSMFREIDKDCSGTLDVDELHSAFSRMGLDMPKHKWKMLLDEIDDDKSGELDYEELLDAVKRFNQGGWDAVRRLDPDRVELTPEERIALVEKCLQTVRDACYSKNKSGPRKDMDMDIKRVFEQFDTDGSGVVDKTEFVNGMKEIGVEDLSDDEIEIVFLHFDRDGAGCDYGEFAWALFNRRQLVIEKQKWALTKQQGRQTGNQDVNGIEGFMKN